MTKRLLHCRCCGQLSPAEYNCCPKYHEALTEITELKKELGYSVCDFTEAQWQDAQNEIAELKRSYQILCDKYDAMEMCDNKIGADAIQEMLDTTGHGLNPDWLKHFRNYADKLRGKQIEPKKKD